MADYYTPERIDWLLRNWGNWHALAETPTTAAGLLRSGPTREVPKLPTKTRNHADPNRWSDTRADILRAAAQLGDHSIEWHTVKCLLEGKPHAVLSSWVQHWTYQTIQIAYDRALERMAEYLATGAIERFDPTPTQRLCAICNEPHQRRSTYCSAACKMRAWRQSRLVTAS